MLKKFDRPISSTPELSPLPSLDLDKLAKQMFWTFGPKQIFDLFGAPLKYDSITEKKDYYVWITTQLSTHT